MSSPVKRLNQRFYAGILPFSGGGAVAHLAPWPILEKYGAAAAMMTAMARPILPERLLEHRRQDALSDAGLLGRPDADPDRRGRRGRHPVLPAVHGLPLCGEAFDLEPDVSDRDLFLRISWLRHFEAEARRREGALRVLIAIVVSGVAAAVLFLIMVQGSFRKGYTASTSTTSSGR